MASVWYIGSSDVRTITAAQWTAVGAPGANTTWNAANGWSLNAGLFTVAQLAVLNANEDFNTAAPDGPRPGEAIIGQDLRAITNADLVNLGLDQRQMGRRNFINDHSKEYAKDVARLTQVSTDFTSVEHSLTSAMVPEVGAGLGNQYVMPAVVDTPIPATMPVDFGSGTMRVWTPGFGAILSPMAYMVNLWRMDHDGDRLVIYGAWGTSQEFMVYVDGQPTSLVGYKPTLSSSFVRIIFPSKKMRTIEIKGSAISFGAVYAVKPYNVFKPKPVGGPRILAVGDSFVQPMIWKDAGGAGNPINGTYQSMAEQLGCYDFLIDGIGSTGYIKESTVGANNNYVQRQAVNHLAFKPDVLWIHGGGCNDVYNGNTNADIIAAIVNYFTKARAALPNAKLVFNEGFKPATMWPADANARYVQIRQAVQTALMDVGVYYIDVATSSPWIYGTGHTPSSPAGDGNNDKYAGDDAIHPNTSGYAFIRDRLARAMRRILRDNGSLINQLI